MISKLKLAASLATLGLALACQPSLAEPTYPERRITLVVPLAPGGPSDGAARLLADHLSTRWGQPVVVENKPGANGIVGASEVAKAAPDGYTLLFAVPSVATFGAFLKDPPVDVGRDLDAVSLIVDKGYYLMVNADLPVHSVEELIAYAKAHPGKLNYGAFAGGALLAVELFKQMTDTDIVRVQYRGEAPAALALAANETQVHLGSLVATQGFIDSGKVRLLGTTTLERLPTLPDLPTLDESAVPGYEARVWYGLMAPAGTPEPIRKKIADEIGRFVAEPAVAQRFKELEYIPRSTSPDAFHELLDQEIKLWSTVAERANIEKQ